MPHCVHYVGSVLFPLFVLPTGFPGCLLRTCSLAVCSSPQCFVDPLHAALCTWWSSCSAFYMWTPWFYVVPSLCPLTPSPGFGFVSFKDEEPADKVCSIQYHDIRGKRVSLTYKERRWGGVARRKGEQGLEERGGGGSKKGRREGESSGSVQVELKQ